jgi:hypothetical protein
MPPFTVLGKSSKTTFLIVADYGLYIEFATAAAVNEGQCVKLDANGLVVPWVKADGKHLLLGIAMTTQALGDNVTVLTRCVAQIFGISNAASNAGPCTLESYDAATSVGGNVGYSKFGLATVGTGEYVDMVGWMIDKPTAANQLVRVLIKN